MWRVVRLLLMWLLAVALPLQGLSAATMLACGAGEHDHKIAQVASHSHGAAAPLHTHVTDSTASERARADHVAPAKADPVTRVAHKCSACASCCINAVVPAASISFDAVRLPDFFAPLVPHTFAAFVTEGLERPPRLFLA